jgi:phage terminase large subunit-like protein
VIDYDCIRADVNELRERFDIKEIAADRWNATQLIGQLTGDGFTIFPFGQGYKDMSPPAKELERLVISAALDHGANPVLRWMASNVSIEEDAAGNIKPSKRKSTERIDGIIALCMGLARATIQGGEEQASAYDAPDAVFSVNDLLRGGESDADESSCEAYYEEDGSYA